MSGFDQNFHIRTQLYIGNLQEIVQSCKPPVGNIAALQSHEVEAFFILIRALIALKQFPQVLALLDSPPSSEFKGAKILANYTYSKQNNDVNAVSTSVTEMKSLLADVVAGTNPAVRVLAGELFLNEGLLEDAFKAVVKPAREQHIECSALLVQIFLKLDRVDLAQKEYQTIASWSSDSVLVQLIEAWIHIASGANKLQEAYYAYEELVQTYGSNTSLLTSMAICQIHMNQLEEAEKLLTEAVGKDPSNSDALANFVVVSTLLNKPQEVIQKFLQQLSTIAPAHSLVAGMKMKSEVFDRMAVRYFVA